MDNQYDNDISENGSNRVLKFYKNKNEHDNIKVELPKLEINNKEDNLEDFDEKLNRINPNKTVKDLEGLSMFDKLVYDTRPFIKYFWDTLKEEHLLLNILFKNSLFEPRYIRILRTLGSITLMYTFNALFYTFNIYRN